MIFVCQYCGKKIGNETIKSNHGALVTHEQFCEKNPNRLTHTNLSKDSRKRMSDACKKRNIASRKPGGWKCHYCDLIFPTQHACYEHQHQVHQKEMGNAYKKKHSGNWQCNYCLAEFRIRSELFSHLKVCEKRLSEPLDKLGRTKSSLHSSPCCCKYCGKQFKTRQPCSYHEHYYCDKNPNKLERKKSINTFESNLKRSIAMAKRKEALLKANGVVLKPNYNPTACEYIDALNKEKGWHLQHALNGGEIKCGPYWMDGYDKDLNIVFEYDEAKHHKPSVRKRDKLREQSIINILHPKEFWRYDEKNNKLYRVC